MKKGAITVIAALIILSATASAINFTFYNLPNQPYNLENSRFDLTRIRAQVDFTQVRLPRVSVSLTQNQINPQCQTRRPANDVFITTCTGEVQFSVRTYNLSPLYRNNLRTTLILSNSQTGDTFEILLNPVREGSNTRRFSAGDLRNFDTWNIQVCSRQTCGSAQDNGAMSII